MVVEGYYTPTGKFTCEQDVSWEPEQDPVTKRWVATKLITLKTWTVYECIGFSGYLTPRYFGLTEEEANQKTKDLNGGKD